MSITDDLMWRYYELLSSKPLGEVQALKAAVAEQREHPKNTKVAFAREIAARFHGEEAAARAVEDFERRFAKKDLNAQELPLVDIPLSRAAELPLAKIATEAKLTTSATEARKLMAQGGIRVNGEKVADQKAALGAGEYLLQVGKLKAARVRLG